MQWKTPVYEVQKCINFAAKVASNGKYLKRDHVTPLLRDLKWINFNSILRLNKASFMYKELCVSTDSNIKKINFDLRNKVPQRIPRNGSDVHIDYRRTAVGQKPVSISGAKLWNSIPMNIINSNTIVAFKSHMYQKSIHIHTYDCIPMICLCIYIQTLPTKFSKSFLLKTRRQFNFWRWLM